MCTLSHASIHRNCERNRALYSINTSLFHFFPLEIVSFPQRRRLGPIGERQTHTIAKGFYVAFELGIREAIFRTATTTRCINPDELKNLHGKMLKHACIDVVNFQISSFTMILVFAFTKKKLRHILWRTFYDFIVFDEILHGSAYIVDPRKSAMERNRTKHVKKSSSNVYIFTFSFYSSISPH